MTFKESLKQNDFVVTAQLNLAETPDAASLIRHGEILRPVVDGVQLTDEFSTQIQMAGLAAAALLIPLGIDPILHMACRDRNRVAMEKDLIGAAAIGVSSVLVCRGKKHHRSSKADVCNVFDISAAGFTAYIQSLKQAEDDLLGADFLIGADAKILDPEPSWVPKNLNRKIDIGSNFIQPQICFDIDMIRNYMAHMVATKLTHRVSFIMTLSPLPSADTARWIRDNVNGAVIPEPIIERLERASDPKNEGVEICAELLQELATIPGVSGANIMTLGRLEMIPAAIEASGVRSR